MTKPPLFPPQVLSLLHPFFACSKLQEGGREASFLYRWENARAGGLPLVPWAPGFWTIWYPTHSSCAEAGFSWAQEAAIQPSPRLCLWFIEGERTYNIRWLSGEQHTVQCLYITGKWSPQWGPRVSLSIFVTRMLKTGSRNNLQTHTTVSIGRTSIPRPFIF